VAALLIGICPGVAAAHPVDVVQIEGTKRTRDATLLALLPRPVPAEMSDVEIEDFARRVSDLAIFDSSEVVRVGAVLRVKVREKWTLLPDLSLETGKSSRDLSFVLGATDNNFLGRGLLFNAAFTREQRGLGFALGLSQNPYGQRRWAKTETVSYRGTAYRFDEGQAWVLRAASLGFALNSPPVGSRYMRYQTGLLVRHETMHEQRGDLAPPSGVGAQFSTGMTFDAYRWNDIRPRGLIVTLDAGPGFMMPAAQPRHFAVLTLKGALPLTSRLVLAARLKAAVITRGNPNASYLVGSVEGVRGLDDARYRNWAQAFVNVELRQSYALFERLWLQLAVFGDAAVFQRMDANGRAARGVAAVATGGGIRLIPTFVAQAALRLDLALLLVPEVRTLFLFGVTQYF
jgi:hypothetical protein